MIGFEIGRCGRPKPGFGVSWTMDDWVLWSTTATAIQSASFEGMRSGVGGQDTARSGDDCWGLPWSDLGVLVML